MLENSINSQQPRTVFVVLPSGFIVSCQVNIFERQFVVTLRKKTPKFLNSLLQCAA